MRSALLFAGAVVLGTGSWIQLNADVDIASRFAEINKEYSNKIRLAQTDSRAANQATKDREVAFAQLVKEAKSSDLDALSFDDELALAACYETLRRYEECIEHCHTAIRMDRNDERPYAPLVRSLLNTRRLDTAELTLESAERRFPGSANIRPLHGLLHAFFMNTGEPSRAATHLSAYVDYEIDTLDDSSSGGLELGKYVSMMLQAYEKAGQRDIGLQRLMTQFANVESKVKAAEQTLANNPDDISSILRMSSVLQASVELSLQLEDSQTDVRQARWLCFLAPQVRKYPHRTDVLKSYANAIQLVTSNLRQPDSMAETEATVQTAIREFALAPRDSSDGKLLSELCQQLRTLHSRIQQNRVHNALIGRPASTALTVDWLGGSPVSFEDLKGSVVLLHFWSANCAHCRANLPTVRSWHEKYGKQGLIVLSVAPYGAFADNETAAPNTKGQAIQDERNALSKIVRQYQISHRVAMFQKESEMGREFAISFYPEFVVLDRSGLIRIIRVGASADKLREIEQLVARYTIEPVAQDSSLPR